MGNKVLFTIVSERSNECKVGCNILGIAVGSGDVVSEIVSKPRLKEIIDDLDSTLVEEEVDGGFNKFILHNNDGTDIPTVLFDELDFNRYLDIMFSGLKRAYTES